MFANILFALVISFIGLFVLGFLFIFGKVKDKEEKSKIIKGVLWSISIGAGGSLLVIFGANKYSSLIKSYFNIGNLQQSLHHLFFLIAGGITVMTLGVIKFFDVDKTYKIKKAFKIGIGFAILFTSPFIFKWLMTSF